ncbi:hypothetical protein DV515_00005782, partial [Chloebia gouldiae]
TYAIRRIRDAFRENKNITDSEKIEELLNKAKANLEVIQRQASRQPPDQRNNKGLTAEGELMMACTATKRNFNQISGRLGAQLQAGAVRQLEVLS